jgi:hypothetical protein
MADLDFIIRLRKDGMPLNAASVTLDLSMPGMFMGMNRPALKKARNGRYEGRGIITTCMSGKKTWRAEVIVEEAKKTEVVDFLFEVK